MTVPPRRIKSTIAKLSTLPETEPRAEFVQFESPGLHGEAQPTVGSSMIPFAASARNKQQISRGPVVPSGLNFPNTMILLDEYEPVGSASRPPLEILQRTSNEVCVDD